MNRRQWRIRTRLLWSFSVLVLLITVVFSLFNFLFVYVVEDEFFARLVEEERQYLIAAWEREGVLPAPRRDFMQIVIDTAALPEDMQAVFAQEPGRPEYAGANGRHYHLGYSQQPPFTLVAEVSEHLVVRQMRRGIFALLITTTLILLLLALALAWWLGNRLVKPVESLAGLFISAPADNLPTDFAAHYPANEVGVLARAMEQAVKRIEAFIEREQSFTRDVSHELRTPIAVMKGALELLSSNEVPGQQAALRRMQSAVLLMEQNIETLLAIAREQQSPPGEPTRLLPLVEQVVIDHAGLLEDKPVTVEVTVDPAISLSADPGRLRILLNNLVSNAFQHTTAGCVTIRSEGGHTLIVEDTGPGIDPAIKEEVFSHFVKGENSAGFGVGLSIVNRLCEHQGWQLRLASSSAGTRVSTTIQ